MTKIDAVAAGSLRFGVSLTPALDIASVRGRALAAEEGGLDLVGVQDHPYVPSYLDAFVVLDQKTGLAGASLCRSDGWPPNRHLT